MEISYDDVLNILKIIDQSSCEELHLEIGDLMLIVRKKGAAASSGAHGTVVPGEMAISAMSGAGTGAVKPPEATPSEARPDAPPSGGSVAPASPAAAAADRSTPDREGAGATEHSILARGFTVKAPMVGIFYRSPAPGTPPFVDVGTPVSEDDTVCIIEVMKLMNSVKAGCRGRVVEICAKDGVLVEYGQPLLVIEPLS